MYILYNYKSNFYSKTQYLKVSWVADSFKYFMVSGLNDIQYNVTVVVLKKVLTSTDTGKNSKKSW